MIARAPQLLGVTFTHVNRLTPAFLPANYDSRSVIAVELVMWRKSLRRLSSLKPPLSVACAMSFGHTSIIVNL
jgi:hypothetical protein